MYIVMLTDSNRVQGSLKYWGFCETVLYSLSNFIAGWGVDGALHQTYKVTVIGVPWE